MGREKQNATPRCKTTNQVPTVTTMVVFNMEYLGVQEPALAHSTYSVWKTQRTAGRMGPPSYGMSLPGTSLDTFYAFCKLSISFFIYKMGAVLSQALKLVSRTKNETIHINTHCRTRHVSTDPAAI